VETDPNVVLELQRIIRSGLESQTELPFVPPPPDGRAAAEALAADAPRGRRPNPRRGR
jgi:hypothetical protein